ncbi:uncharacterized protein LOC118467290 isoform X2 [Anopheles albimanus]|uniref:uncharacterized protein LOC118467290 isoform X2 n=1 Tax=Anopheles albimanus TaxID=7167 RepID=UPI001641ECD6|nr:uncharacterized protein LOC118467290 isoform X2 [Anopheles albimanus]
MDSSVFLVAAVASIILCNPVKNELTLRDYNKLPRIYEYDDFSKCQNLFSNKFVYCVVSIQLHPNNSSMLWRYIDRLGLSGSFLKLYWLQIDYNTDEEKVLGMCEKMAF